MDGQRFDSFTRALVSGASRRSILKGLLGIGGAAAGGSRIAAGDARTLRTRSTVPPPSPPQTTSTTPSPCPPGESLCLGHCCPNGQCTASEGCCAGGMTLCADRCCPAGHCTRSGNQDFCCDGGRTPCGLDCCPTAEQCCDRECCASGSICTGEERCCPVEQFCSGICCNGPGQRCCGGVCLQEGECCVAAECPDSPATCQTGTCSAGVCGLSAICDGSATGELCCDGACQECCGDDASVCSSNQCETWSCQQGSCVLDDVETCAPDASNPICHTQRCDPDSGACVNDQYRGDDQACGSGGSGICCSEQCVAIDEQHCGTCDVQCAPGFVCIDKSCQCDEHADCAANEVCCSGACQECCTENLSACTPASHDCKEVYCNAGACAIRDIQNGLPCAGGTCANGSCCTGCVIGGTCIPDSTINPDNACEYCNATASRTGWSQRITCMPSGSSCMSAACDPATGQCVEVEPYRDSGTPCFLSSTEVGQCFTGACDGFGACLPAPKQAGETCMYHELLPTCLVAQCDGAGNCAPAAKADDTTCTQLLPSACSSGSGTCQQGQCVAEPLPDMEGESCDSNPFPSPCTQSICRDGICTGEAINEGEECVPTFQQIPPVCKQGVGICTSGVCELQNQPNGTICAMHSSWCFGNVCQDGVCDGEVVDIREGELCRVGVEECRVAYCSNGGCTIQGNSNFCDIPEHCAGQTGVCLGNGECQFGQSPRAGEQCGNQSDCCPGELCIPLPTCTAFGCATFCQVP